MNNHYERMYHDEVAKLHTAVAERDAVMAQRDTLTKELESVSRALSGANASLGALYHQLGSLEDTLAAAGANLPKAYKIITMHTVCESPEWELVKGSSYLLERHDGTLRVLTWRYQTRSGGRGWAEANKVKKWGQIV